MNKSSIITREQFKVKNKDLKSQNSLNLSNYTFVKLYMNKSAFKIVCFTERKEIYQ